MMANGATTTADVRVKRNHKPRISSVEGTVVRMQIRAAHVPSTKDKYADGFKVPGSRNLKKVGR